MEFYDNDITFLKDPKGYLIKILDSYLPIGLRGCVVGAELLRHHDSFDRLLRLRVVYPNGALKLIQAQVPYITEYVDIFEKVARFILEAYYVEVG